VKSLEEYIDSEIRAAEAGPRDLAPGECRSDDGVPCGLCHAMRLEYRVEIAAKQRALARFWSEQIPWCPADPIVPSPRGREYRTVTKRKVFSARREIRLGLIGPSDHPRPGGIPVVRCAIEPAEHSALYAAHAEPLNAPWCAALRDSLVYVVIKGSYRRATIIWNVREITPGVIRSANTLSKSLTRAHGDLINGVLLYRGDDDGRYYLGSRDPGGKPDLRKLYGRPDILARVGDRTFLYPPLSFSQVNSSMVETFVAHAYSLLEPAKEETLYDLYCGYGLFALSFSAAVRQVIGAEVSPASIAAARANAREQGARNCRFVCANIGVETLRTVMGEFHRRAAVILDPPRGGTAPGVIEAVAERQPARVLHIFCNSDLLGPDLKLWGSHGYRALRAVPLDMFPGTSEVETLVLLRPHSQGKSSKGIS
jgi:tRNA/tmRNA/rRNA uracil-C5-methylase (TrmA/RlmC/RlmD family)